MESKNLLSHISELEAALNSFSFEELNTADAAQLKQSFDQFKINLEERIWGPEQKNIETTSQNRENARSSTSVTAEQARHITNIIHKFDSPLNEIACFSELLKEGTLSTLQKEQLYAIQLASRSLMDLLNDFLEYSKLLAGMEEFNMVPFHIHNLIKEVAFLSKTLIVDKNISFEVRLDSDIPSNLLGDPSKLSEVLLSLLGNTIKFTDTGSILFSTHVIALHNNQCSIEFIIKHTANCKAEEDPRQIYHVFQQADQHTFTKYDSAESGLIIVKQIVDKLGGTISIQNQQKEGTELSMILDFPLLKKQTIEMKANKQLNKKSVDTLKVLVFEDNALNQWLIKKRLKSWGCTFFITEHAVEGLQILEEEMIDVVFMDLHMPVVDGYEITRRIRINEQERIAQVPVIALTADFTAKDKDKASRDGINDFILKPYTAEELLDKLIQYGFSNQGSTIFQGTVKDDADLRPNTDGFTKLNLSAVLEDCMGEVEMLAELVELYKRNALEFIGKAKLHLQNRDLEQLQFATHKIKAGLAMMKTQNLLILVQQLHGLCSTDKNYDQMNYLYQQFVKEYSLVEFALDAEVTRLKKEN